MPSTKELCKQAEEAFSKKSYTEANNLAQLALSGEPPCHRAHLIFAKLYLLNKKQPLIMQGEAATTKVQAGSLEAMQALQDPKELTEENFSSFIRFLSQPFNDFTEQEKLEIKIILGEFCLYGNISLLKKRPEKPKKQKLYKEEAHEILKKALLATAKLEIASSLLSKTLRFSIKKEILFFQKFLLQLYTLTLSNDYADNCKLLLLSIVLANCQAHKITSLKEQNLFASQQPPVTVDQIKAAIHTQLDKLIQPNIPASLLLDILLTLQLFTPQLTHEQFEVIQNAIRDITNESVQMEAGILLAEFYLKTGNSQKATSYLLWLLSVNNQSHEESWKARYLPFQEHFNDEQQAQYDALIVAEGADFKVAQAELAKPDTEKDYNLICRSLQKAANNGEEKAIKKLISLMSDKSIYQAAIVIYDLIEYSENNPEKQHLATLIQQLILRKNKKDTVFGQIRKHIEKAHREQQWQVNFTLARLRYDGHIFQQNYFIAFDLFNDSLHENNMAKFWLAKMCFEGNGVFQDLIKANNLLDELDIASMPNELKAEYYYIKGEISYVFYQRNPSSSSIELQNSVNAFYEALTMTEASTKIFTKALLSLYIAARYAGSTDAKSKISVLLSSNENIRKILEHEIPLAELVEFWPSIFPITHLSTEILVNDARQALEKNDTTQFLALLKNDATKQTAFKELVVYYKSKNDTGILNVLSTLCYATHRYSLTSSYITQLHELLKAVANGSQVIQITEPLNETAIESYRQQLETYEEQKSDYFDENISDVSDEEQDESRQKTDRRLTHQRSSAQDIAGKLQAKLLEKLRALEKLKKFDQETFQKYQADFISAFSEVATPIETSSAGDIVSEINTLNYYKAQGKLEEGLRQVGNHYIIALVRGHHFSKDLWNQQERRGVRSKIVDKNHPFVEQKLPIYSSTVFAHAKVTNFSDVSRITQLRLFKSALFLSHYLGPKLQEPTINEDELTENYRVAMSKCGSTKTRGEQLHQLYTSDYQLFHQFLREHQNSELLPFANDKNIYCSFGRVPNLHSGRYAAGIKYYNNKQRQTRLGPAWGKSLRAHRHQSGYVLLGIFPLEDLALKNYGDVITMSTENRIRIPQTILPEQEFSFPIMTKPDRIKYIDLLSYPSFDGNYRPVHLVKYFLQPDTYTKFQKLLRDAKPHSHKYQLIHILLGSYLSAAQSLFLLREAHDYAKKTKQVLLFLDRHGLFTIKPTNDISPFPVGNDHASIARRLYAHRQRQNKNGSSADEEMDNHPGITTPPDEEIGIGSADVPTQLSSLPQTSTVSLSMQQKRRRLDSDDEDSPLPSNKQQNRVATNHLSNSNRSKNGKGRRVVESDDDVDDDNELAHQKKKEVSVAKMLSFHSERKAHQGEAAATSDVDNEEEINASSASATP